MLKPSLILLATVLFIIETDFPEPSIYYNNSNNGSTNVTIVNNGTNNQYPGMLYNNLNISDTRSNFQINMFDFSVRNLMRFNWSAKHIYNTLDKYVYDPASLQFAQNLIYSYIATSQYKYNNIYAQIVADSNAPWYNLWAKIRNNRNEHILNNITNELKYQNSALSILQNVYINNINLTN